MSSTSASANGMTRRELPAKSNYIELNIYLIILVQLCAMCSRMQMFPIEKHKINRKIKFNYESATFIRTNNIDALVSNIYILYQSRCCFCCCCSAAIAINKQV